MRPGRDRLAGLVEVDETFIGGEEHGLRGWRQPGKKVLTGIAVEISEPKGIGRCRMAVLADASAATLGPFVAGNVEPGSRVITDGWVGYNGLASRGCAHERRNQKAAARRGEDPGDLLPAVHRVASLCKRWRHRTRTPPRPHLGRGCRRTLTGAPAAAVLGTHQGRVDLAHLQAYLNEFAFRFNRRHSRSRGLVSTACWISQPGTTPSATTTSSPSGSHATCRRSAGAPAIRPAWTAPPRPGPGEPLKCSSSSHSA